MTTVTPFVAAGNRDAMEYGDGTFNSTATYVEQNTETSTSSSSYRCFGVSFQLNVPPGATINTAYITFILGSQVNANCEIYAEDVDDSADFATTTNVISRTRTTASTTWDAAALGSVGDPVNTPSIVSAVQEVVNRAGWVSGNYITLLFIADTDINTDRLIVYAYEDATYAPAQLTVDYTPASVDPGYSSTPAASGTVTFGSIDVGSSDTQTITVSETGDADLTVSDPVITGVNNNEFAFDPDAFPFTITNGGSDVDITLTAMPMATGARSATLTLTTNDPANPTVSYTLSATGAAVTGLPHPSTAVDEFRIDWDADETFDHASGDLTGRLISIQWSEGYPFGGDEFIAPPTPLTAVLENEDGAFFQENGAATFQGLIVKGLRVRYRITYNGVTQQMWIGGITNCQLTTSPINGGRVKTVTITATDPSEALQFRRYAPHMLVDNRTDQIIGDVLNQVVVLPYYNGVWVLGASVLGTNTTLPDLAPYITLEEGIETIPFAGVDVGTDAGVNAHEYLRDAVAAELGGRLFYNPRTGQFEFHNRHYDTYNNVVVHTFDTSNTPDGQTLPPLTFGQDVVNSVTVGYQRVAVGTAASVIWASGDVVAVRPLETNKFVARYRDPDNEATSCAAYECIAPVRNVDFVANSAEDGSGDDITARVGVYAQYDATQAHITLVNDHPTATAYFQTLRVRGTPLLTYDRQTVSAADAASISANGLYDLEYDVPMVSDSERLQSYANQIVQRQAMPLTTLPALPLLPGQFADHMWFVLQWAQVGKRVALDYSGDGWSEHAAEYIIQGVQYMHRADDPQGLQCTLLIKRAERAQGWKLGVSQLEVDTVLVL